MEREHTEKHYLTYQVKKEARIVWTINDFKQYTKEMDKCIEGPSFRVSSNPLTRWFLILCPFENEDKNNVGLYIHLKESILQKTKASFMVSIINSDKQKCLTRQFSHSFEKEGTFRISDFLQRSELFENTNLLPNGNLSISCKLSVYIKKLSKQVNNGDKKEDRLEYQLDLLPTLESKLFADVILVVEGKEIAAHKCILSTHSDVFLTMFNADMVEQKTNRVEIEDLSFEVVTEMVRFFYSGKAPPYGKNSEELLKAADKYNVRGLMHEIEDKMIKQVSLLNACDSLILAHMYDLAKAKEFLKKFIFIHNFEELKRSKEINKLHAIQDLCFELFKYLSEV